MRGIVSAEGSATFDGAPVPGGAAVHAVVDGWIEGGPDVARLYEDQGERCVESLRGSFALAIWDSRERKLVLARDAFGTKALHHASDHGRFLFASEPAAILGELRGKPHVDPISIDDVLAFGWTEGRRTGYEEIERLYAGEIAVHRAGKLERRPWWSPPRTTAPRPADAMVRELERSVRACLGEGGAPALLLSFDVGSILLLQTLARVCEPVRTYSAAIEGSLLQTLPLAEKVGAQRHCDVTVAVKDLPQVVEETLTALDAPFADPELVLLRLACQAARKETRVCLIADGGEQVLGRGARYAWMRTTGSRPRPPIALIPVYRALAGALSSVASTRLSTELRTRIDNEDRRYVSGLVATEDVLRRRLLAEGRRGAHRQNGSERELWDDFGIADDLEARMRRHDLRHALPNGILARSQRAAAPFGLELRFPFLHPDVLAEAGSIPLPPGPQEGIALARRMVPALAPLVDGYLVGSRLAADGWLSQSTIAAVVRAHRRRSGFERTIFALLALEIWYRRRIRGS